MKFRKTLASGLLALLSLGVVLAPTILAGCAAVGLSAPKNLSEGIVAGYQSVAGAADIVGVLLDADKVSVDEAKAFLKRGREVKLGLDEVVKLKDLGDFSNASARLGLVEAALRLLQADLAVKQGGVS